MEKLDSEIVCVNELFTPKSFVTLYHRAKPTNQFYSIGTHSRGKLDHFIHHRKNIYSNELVKLTIRGSEVTQKKFCQRQLLLKRNVYFSIKKYFKLKIDSK